ncbi:siderophore ABC transporter substrate-binding protein [Rhizobium sp. SL86]|uniref:siderophore ABC transporter substrate-binding protein n=1 Tax=Rhizobium sp. SL86 TaxID=2995148 RepID=UPI003FA3AB66
MTMRISARPLALLAAAVTLALSALPSFADPITIKHAQGETTLKAAPKTVVTFDLATLDTLDALGIPVAGVPKAPMPDYLKKYQADNVEKVGTLFEPDYEAIAALQPDLIIVSARSAAKLKELSKLAPTIDMSVDGAKFLAQSEENVRTLAGLFGKAKEADAALAKLNTSEEALRQKAKGAGTGLLILTTGGKISTYGPGSRFGALFTDYGMTPADSTIQADTHGQQISFEYILEKNPDWLFVIDRDAAVGREGQAASALLDNEIVRQTKAWKNGHVVYMDGVAMYIVGGGLTAMQKTIDQLATALAKN